MPRTQLTGGEVQDQSVKRADLNISQSGSAVIVRAVGSTNVTLSSTGADTGTGDVTFDLSTTGVGAGTYTKVQVDIYGRVISASNLSASDIPSGSTNYIWNQIASVQSAGFSINGNAHVASVRLWNTANTFYIQLQGPTGQASNVTFTFPGTVGNNGQALTSDGSGGLAWSDLNYVPLSGGTAATITRSGDANHLYLFRNANTVTNSSAIIFQVLNSSSTQVINGMLVNTLRDNTAGAHNGAMILSAARASATYQYLNIGTNASGNEGIDILRGNLYFQNDTQLLRNSAGVIRTPGQFYVGASTSLQGALVTQGGSVTSAVDSNYRVLLHFEGENGSRVILNSGAYASPVFLRGSNYYTTATLSTAQKKFGQASCLFAGNSVLEIPFKFAIGTTDFNIDFHVRFTSVAGTQTILDIGGSSGILLSYSGGTWTLTVAGTACTFSQTPTANVWYHIAMSRTSNSVRFFVDGTKTGTTQTASGSASTGSSNLFLGSTSSLTNYVSAYVDEFRFMTASQYTTDSNITVPTAPYDPYGFRYTASEASAQPFTGKVLVGDGAGGFTPQKPPRILAITFALTENVANTTKYFYAHRSAGNTQEDNKRSGNGSGLSFANSCSPAFVPFNGRITNAVLTIQGVGVNNGTVSYPVQYRVDMFRVGFSAEHDPNINGGSAVTMNFPVSAGVGLFSVGSTNTRVELRELDIAVLAGDPIALKFINGSGASQASLTQMAFVTLLIEETF